MSLVDSHVNFVIKKLLLLKPKTQRNIATDLSIEHVGVKLPVARVDPARVGLEEAKRQRFRSRVALVSEKRVRVDRERRFVVLE